MRRIGKLLGACALALSLPAQALAAGGEAVGENLGDLLSSWAVPLFAGVAGLISLVFLMNRKYSELALFVVAAVVVGGFVLAPESISNVVGGIWQAITG